MNIVCLDLEGVLTPEVWHHVARRSGVEDLMLTTRDVKNYRELMDRRVETCRRHGIDLKTIQAWIAELSCMEGSVEFTRWLMQNYQLIILSDTFYEFAGQFMRELGNPTLFCHTIRQDEAAGKLVYTLRQENQKACAVQALRSLNFNILAAGDSYNDVQMLKAANIATFFRAPLNINDQYPEYRNLQTYEAFQQFIVEALG